ncbi:pyridine nucleotide-disulfide oxidoreductase [Aureococcus anophagefferens]|nr:pyridine nucleotide-disulfide oxidoreductase [Aureococcus anophagefferens]
MAAEEEFAIEIPDAEADKITRAARARRCAGLGRRRAPPAGRVSELPEEDAPQPPANHPEPYDVVVVGAGAAGVGVALMLTGVFGLDAGRVLLVERGGAVGETFRRWPKEMRFISPSFNSQGWTQSFDLNSVAYGTSPAFTLHAEHPTGAQYARYLEALAETNELNVRAGTEVTAVTPRDGGFDVAVVPAAGGVPAVIKTRYVVWAAGEFQYPRASAEPLFPGSELCRHNSSVRSWKELEGDDFVVVGGYESGMDAASNLSLCGKRCTVVSSTAYWDVSTEDPSSELAPYTAQRVRAACASATPPKLLAPLRVFAVDAAAGGGFAVRARWGDAVEHEGGDHREPVRPAAAAKAAAKAAAAGGEVELRTPQAPLLCAGFEGGVKLGVAKDLFAWGDPAVGDDDEEEDDDAEGEGDDRDGDDDGEMTISKNWAARNDLSFSKRRHPMAFKVSPVAILELAALEEEAAAAAAEAPAFAALVAAVAAGGVTRRIADNIATYDLSSLRGGVSPLRARRRRAAVAARAPVDADAVLGRPPPRPGLMSLAEACGALLGLRVALVACATARATVDARPRRAGAGGLARIEAARTARLRALASLRRLPRAAAEEVDCARAFLDERWVAADLRQTMEGCLEDAPLLFPSRGARGARRARGARWTPGAASRCRDAARWSSSAPKTSSRGARASGASRRIERPSRLRARAGRGLPPGAGDGAPPAPAPADRWWDVDALPPRERAGLGYDAAGAADALALRLGDPVLGALAARERDLLRYAYAEFRDVAGLDGAGAAEAAAAGATRAGAGQLREARAFARELRFFDCARRLRVARRVVSTSAARSRPSATRTRLWRRAAPPLGAYCGATSAGVGRLVAAARSALAALRHEAARVDDAHRYKFLNRGAGPEVLYAAQFAAERGAAPPGAGAARRLRGDLRRDPACGRGARGRRASAPRAPAARGARGPEPRTLADALHRAAPPQCAGPRGGPRRLPRGRGRRRVPPARLARARCARRLGAAAARRAERRLPRWRPAAPPAPSGPARRARRPRRAARDAFADDEEGGGEAPGALSALRAWAALAVGLRRIQIFNPTSTVRLLLAAASAPRALRAMCVAAHLRRGAARENLDHGRALAAMAEVFAGFRAGRVGARDGGGACPAANCAPFRAPADAPLAATATPAGGRAAAVLARYDERPHDRDEVEGPGDGRLRVARGLAEVAREVRLARVALEDRRVR